MLPDLLSPKLRPGLDTTVQATTPVKNISDVLTDYAPGQKLTAQIQALLPNGAYRALVGQRELTLALPFSAKAGDTLELEVRESDGKLALTLATGTGGTNTSTAADTATTLSNTGRLIGDLLGGVSEEGKRAAPAPLNGNMALVDQFPATGGELAPVLKQALTQSGVFYEAHQARWVAGELPTEALRQEPQGKVETSSFTSAGASASLPEKLAVDTASGAKMAGGVESTISTGGLPRDIAPIVQQQLDALATQNYAWQGQVWPGQNMRWEISEDPERQRGSSDRAEAGRWQTRLRLNLPMLGDIDATLRLKANGAVDLSVTTDSTESESRLRGSLLMLRDQLEAAGLSLSQALVQHGEAAE